MCYSMKPQHTVGQRAKITHPCPTGFGGLTGTIVGVSGHLVTVALDAYKDTYYNPTDKVTYNHRVAFGRGCVQALTGTPKSFLD